MSPHAETARHPTDVETVYAEFSQFFVCGDYVGLDTDRPMLAGSAYVERFRPVDVTRPYPIVLIHGGYQTGTNFTGTPDGRRGWAHDFLRAGYDVYVVDQTGRGRSGQNEELFGATERRTAYQIEQRWTAARVHRLWPRAALHTQWPGEGRPGDRAFDRFFASQVPMHPRAVSEDLFRKAGAELLDRIGPAILLTHSQSGSLGWVLSEERSRSIKAIIAVEPVGPPFYDLDLLGPQGWSSYKQVRERPWAIARVPLSFDPPLSEASDIAVVRQDADASDDLVPYHLQAEPARTLPNLSGIPVAVVTGEASFHGHYDHATVAFLAQAGVGVEHIRLEQVGIHGNGHMMMLEKNNHEIADVLIHWLEKSDL